jgi:hypothetical protein
MQFNKRLATAFARLSLSVVGGVAAGHFLFNQAGDKPYAAPVGGALATSLTAAAVARKKKLDNSGSISITPVKAKKSEPSIKSGITPGIQPAVKPSFKTAEQPSAGRVKLAKTPRARAQGRKSRESVDESPYLQFAFQRTNTPNYSRVVIWCHGFQPQEQWQNILAVNLAAIKTIEWRIPKINSASIIQFTGTFNGHLSTEEFRNAVNEPLLAEAVKYNGEREISTWMSFNS